MVTISRDILTSALGAFRSVENAPSRNGENTAPNQFIIRFENGEVFQSYRTFIGAKIGGKLYLSNCHDYSNTTSRFCGAWCGMSAKERRKAIADEKVIVVEG